MEEYYLRHIEICKKGNMDIYKEVLLNVVGEKLPWKEVKSLNTDQLRTIYLRLKDMIVIKQSKYDIEKLSRAIQNSRSGIGGCALTEFECLFCKNKEVWSSTAVPMICKDCATKMAMNIVLREVNIEKDQ